MRFSTISFGVLNLLSSYRQTVPTFAWIFVPAEREWPAVAITVDSESGTVLRNLL